jgi:hypothetical protein
MQSTFPDVSVNWLFELDLIFEAFCFDRDLSRFSSPPPGVSGKVSLPSD